MKEKEILTVLKREPNPVPTYLFARLYHGVWYRKEDKKETRATLNRLLKKGLVTFKKAVTSKGRCKLWSMV